MSFTKRRASKISPSSENGSWSVGPTENCSDWVVEVVDTENTAKVTSYHVHRKDLAFGTHKSEYFATLFNCKGLKESSSSVTRLELESTVAQAIPVMLDFLYTGKLDGVRNTHIVPLFWFADYFMIESLQRLLKGARKKSLTTDIVAVYENAVYLGHEETLDAIVHYVNGFGYTYFKYYDKAMDFLEAISPVFFLRLIQPKDGISTSVECWHDVVRKYVSLHAFQIDDDIFSKIIDKLYPSSETFDIGDIDKVVQLLKACPNVKELPIGVQKQVVESVVNVASEDMELPLENKLELIWRVLDVTKDIDNVNDRLLSTLHSSLDQFFTHHPTALESLQEDKVQLLYTLLPDHIFLKLFSTLQKQCIAHKSEAADLKDRHERELLNKSQSRRSLFWGTKARDADFGALLSWRSV